MTVTDPQATPDYPCNETTDCVDRTACLTMGFCIQNARKQATGTRVMSPERVRESLREYEAKQKYRQDGRE